MKKTLLSVLAGLTVIGSASAAPTPEDRKALCQLLIDKGTHVWVEKTKACIPVDPCNEEVYSDIHQAYCIIVFGTNPLPPDTVIMNKLVNTYAEKVLNTQVTNLKTPTFKDKYGYDKDRVAITTSDGGYYVFADYAKHAKWDLDSAYLAGVSFEAHGYRPISFTVPKSDTTYDGRPFNRVSSVPKDYGDYRYISANQCHEIAQFASGIYSNNYNSRKTFEESYEDGVCTLILDTNNKQY